MAPHENSAPVAIKPPANLLIVEDDHLVAMEMESVLLDAGFEITGIAATAEDALRQAQSVRPDLVLMNIRLAGVRDGVDAAIDLYSQMGITLRLRDSPPRQQNAGPRAVGTAAGLACQTLSIRGAASGGPDGAFRSEALKARKRTLRARAKTSLRIAQPLDARRVRARHPQRCIVRFYNPRRRRSTIEHLSPIGVRSEGRRRDAAASSWITCSFWRAKRPAADEVPRTPRPRLFAAAN